MPHTPLAFLSILIGFAAACTHAPVHEPSDPNYGCWLAAGTTDVTRRAATAATAPPDSSLLVLQVRDVLNGEAVEAGQAQLLDPASSIVSGAMTDHQGHGRLATTNRGVHRLHLRRLGYVPYMESVGLRPGYIDTVLVSWARAEVCMWVTPTSRPEAAG